MTKKILAFVLLAYALTVPAVEVAGEAGDPSIQVSQPAGAGHDTSNVTSSFDEDASRQKLIERGIDPNSDQGKILLRWLAKAAEDPAWQAAARSGTLDVSAVWASSLSSTDRHKALRLIANLVGGTASDCLVLRSHRDLYVTAATMSPPGLENVMELLQILADNAASPHPAEAYSTADLIQGDAAIVDILLAHAKAQGDSGEDCKTFAAQLDAVLALPEPVRDFATFEFFQARKRRKLMLMTVLADPIAYLDEEFDERRLPDSMQASLPQAGSDYLPFRRITFDGVWVNTATPSNNVPFKDTFINRRDNGVISEVTVTPKWVDFNLTFGVATLRAQKLSLVAPTKVADYPVAFDPLRAGHALASGDQVDLALPERASEGPSSLHCVVGNRAAASTVFASLKGESLELECTETHANAPSTKWNGVWLERYRIVWVNWIVDDRGRTDSVIRGVTLDDKMN
jgi:hypothetical protein